MKDNKIELINFECMRRGLHWVYKNKTGETLSIICHDFSYGWEEGLFEISCSWLPDVKGFLNFGQVQRKIDRLKRGKK